MLTACTSDSDQAKVMATNSYDADVIEMPLNEWIKLENTEKNELVIKVLKEAGLELKDYREYFRLVIKELDKGLKIQKIKM
jgi:hypothetical protein